MFILVPNSYYTTTRIGPRGTKIMGLSSYTLVSFCVEDCCDGVVTYLCSAIETCGFPRDDAVLHLLLLAYLLLALVLAVLLYAYVLVGSLVLVVW
jgi:hypothetical protein